MVTRRNSEKVWGLIRFKVEVTNHRNESIVAIVNFSMRWLGTGSDNILEPFTVEPHDSVRIHWDCGPMLRYFTTFTIYAGGITFIRHGFTLLGFNVYFPFLDEVE